METPSSTRRVTRSQTLAASNSAIKISVSTEKVEESEKKTVEKSRTRTGRQSALIDITNDSPIVGLAMGNLETPSSEMSKKRTYGQGKQFTTPGSGEALLRGQVKTLLQKVEEEAGLSKISLENNRPFLHLKGIVNSPMGLLAPTPANTPLMNFSDNELPAVTASPVEDKFDISQMINEMFEGEKKEDNRESEKSYPTRSLLVDFYEKTEGSESSSVCSSVLTDQGCEIESKEKTSSDDDNASMWSIQVNASTKDDEEDGLEGEYDDDNYDEIEEEYDDDNYDEIEDDGGVVELCGAISKMDVNEGHNKVIMAKFEGKHTRFLYNSDDELEGTEEKCSVVEAAAAVASSPGVLHLKGLSTPKGKHLRFTEELSE
ncbi:putative snakin-2-like [Capsicum annuum]|uniref:Uncharacterized protein n=1 Tax=Capsicum annuum TaxID=4072 RepID=A0A1U8FVQ3_CAPAN|nr:uncharacterized protein LOC107859882 [Capsicum annuum]KAF3623967.1 putative snakin-2-like [Capsicum annuum]KAF3651499.1 putative snakin-2-like [Capsicum annuum]PHT91152.1 hypothetical protein T459_06265 [Capsicum annuum]